MADANKRSGGGGVTVYTYLAYSSAQSLVINVQPSL